MKLCQLCGKVEATVNHHIDYHKKILMNVCRKCHGQIHIVLRNINPSPLEKPVKLECKCSYIWIYKGKNPFYATCPNCLNKVNVRTNVKNDQE